MRTLTGEQEQAVARRAEPLLLAAGAGSGKTSVLVERFVRAVREDGVAPGKILAITFTERAAGELRERVRGRFLELDEREAARDTEAAFLSTFHGFCARLLRAHALAAELDPEFEILDEGLAGRIRERAFTAALREFLAGGRTEAVDLLAAYGPDRVRALVEGTYAELRSGGSRLPTLPRPLPREDADPEDLDGALACGLLGELLVGFGRFYDAFKRARGAVDFDDLELCACELLQRRESVRRAWSERFELLMVDEFQDTNPRQLAILTSLQRENLFTVGDELQSIYGFRHAQVSLFRARRAELLERGKSLELVSNFRSRAPLLEVVNAVFEQRFGSGYTPLTPAREQAEQDGAGERAASGSAAQAGAEPLVELLLTDRRGWDQQSGGGEAVAEVSWSTPRWRHAEARALARRVADLVAAGQVRAGEVAVLLRAVGDLEVFERALRHCGLRTLATVGGFWGRQEVGDLLTYLRALANPLDELALYGTLASPLVGCSSDGLALIARAAGAGRQGVWATARRVEEVPRLPAADRSALVAFRGLFEAERRTASRRTIAQLLERAVRATGYREHVLELEWGERRLANVHKLVRLARRFEASEGRDLRGFLDHAGRHEQANGAAIVAEPDAPVSDVEPDAVRLMSIHAAKGLEFPVVCIADLGRAQNLGVPDLLVDGERIGLRLARLDGAQALPSLDFDELCRARKDAQAEEEERILYVAMTRARERLILSGAVDFERWPEQRQGAPTISWLGPALAADLPALVGEAGEAVCDLTVGASGKATVRLRLNTPASVGADMRVGAPTSGASTHGPDIAATPADRADRAARSPARPARSEGVDGPVPVQPTPDRFATLSYTALAELERCGYRYYLERVLGLAEKRAAAQIQLGYEGLDARARGRLVHKLLESVDFARSLTPTSQDIAQAARALSIRVGRSEREEIATILDTAVDSPLAKRIAIAHGVRREHHFAFSPGPAEPLVTGVIDLLAREPDGGWLVIDYKSDRVAADQELEELVERDYGVQRLLYALAVLRDGAPRVEIVHWFLERPRGWVGALYTAADRARLEERLATRIGHARADAFEVSPTPRRSLCETCPGRAGLCSWSDAETMVKE
jgi:ATP-dependent helicase/nuclease subunit A